MAAGRQAARNFPPPVDAVEAASPDQVRGVSLNPRPRVPPVPMSTTLPQRPPPDKGGPTHP